MRYDELQLLRGVPYEINKHIKISQPTLDDIYRYGEREYFSLVSLITSVPADLKSNLWDIGVDYTKIEDFQLFVLLCKNFNVSDTSILFGNNLDLSSLGFFLDNENQEMFLGESVNRTFKEDGIKIDKHIYMLMTDYIRKMHGFKINDEIPGNEFTKKILIDLDREDKKRNENKEYTSQLAALIKSLVNCSEFKYNFENVWNLPISIFLDSVNQIQKYKNVQHVMQGIYSGNIDMKKINQNDLNWTGVDVGINSKMSVEYKKIK